MTYCPEFHGVGAGNEPLQREAEVGPWCLAHAQCATFIDEYRLVDLDRWVTHLGFADKPPNVLRCGQQLPPETRVELPRRGHISSPPMCQDCVATLAPRYIAPTDLDLAPTSAEASAGTFANREETPK